jgi:hypothetical protein
MEEDGVSTASRYKRKRETTSKLVLIIGTLAILEPIAFSLQHLSSIILATPPLPGTPLLQIDEGEQMQKTDDNNSNETNTLRGEVGAWEVMPAKDEEQLKPATICACAKCGSTSLWTELFAIAHRKSFDSMNYKGPPWIHDLSNKKLWTTIRAKKRTDWSNFKEQDSFALIRDPKERILSAWRSKVTCDTDKEIGQHYKLIPHLLNLAGSSSNITARHDRGFPCLNLSEFLAVLFQIHTRGRESFLNSHFLPQHLGCFKYVPPSMWTVVMTISDPNARCSLKSVVLRSYNTSRVPGDDCRMVKSHDRANVLTNLTIDDEVILYNITTKEYEMLAQYLVG